MNEPDFAAVVDAHYANLYRFALSLSRNEADACDLVQQTFAIYLKKWRQLRDPAKVKTWLFTTLRREFMGDQRKEQRFLADAAENVPAVELSVEASQAEALDTEAVMRALALLPLEYREPLTLFYLRDSTYVEISEILEIPTGTVMSRLSRGKQRLRAFLTDGQTP